MEVPETLRVAIETAKKASFRGGHVGNFAVEMLRLLKETEKALAAIGSPAGARIVTRRSKEGLNYTVDKNGEVLIERRKGAGSKAFRCPKSLYDAMAQVIGAARWPLASDEIAAEVGKIMGEVPANYQLRVPLRLWLSTSPALVNRSRARYRPVDHTTMLTEATALWRRLRTSQ